MTNTNPTPAPGPYGTQGLAYVTAGWAPLPLPPHAKKHPPTGYTGAGGAWPSYADVYAWTETHPDGNIALRLPPGVVGIDVDNYDTKPGGLVLHQLEHDLGTLPPTWRSTSRDDGTSGIRLYQVPEGLRWPSVLGPGIEVIRHAHRYAVAWPSIHPDTERPYRWITPDGATALSDIPVPADLPHLPDQWVVHFTGGALAEEQERANLADTAANDWLTTRQGAGLCRGMESLVTKAITGLATAGSRHDHALAETNRLIWTAGTGHTGITTALERLRAAFLTATAGERSQGEAEAEWDRMILGAVNLAVPAHPNEPPPDPCTDPFAGLLARKDTPWESAQTAPTATEPTSNGFTPPSSPEPSTTSSSDASSVDENSESPSSTERTTWWPRPLDGILDGTLEEEVPEHLARSDGHCLLYAGRINGIIGPSESGKTWVALAALVQDVRAGRRCTIIDFEDTERGMTMRLLSLGLTPEQIRTYVAYIGPDEPLAMAQAVDLHEHLDTWDPRLVILDGFNAAMTLHDLDLLSNKDVTVFFQKVLNHLIKNGATVVYIDHTPKDKNNESSGGIGAQAKRAMTDGATLRASITKEFGKGQKGNIRLFVDKDRHGGVRAQATDFKVGERSLQWIADVTLTPRGEDVLSIELQSPETVATGRAAFRPTVYMERVSNWLQDNPGAGRNDILAGVEGKGEHVKTALRILVEEGWVTTTPGERRKVCHHVDLPYSEVSELAGASPKTLSEFSGVPWGPTGVPDPGEVSGVPGVPRGDVVSTSQDPTHGKTSHSIGPVGSRTPPDRWTPIAGGVQEANMVTGEVRDR